MIFDSVEENGQRVYVAEFKATGPFSLHIERRESGRITVYQKSYENGKYATVKNVDIAPQDTIIDAEVPGGVFPKWIKIKSSSAVEVAEVTFEGEQSGGGAGTESTMEYLDVSGVSDASTLLILKQTAQSVKWRSTAESNAGVITIAPYGFVAPGSVNGVESAEYLAAAIDLEQLVVIPGFGLNEPSPLSTLIGSTLAAIPRITKEQFYNLSSEEDSGGLKEGDVLYYSDTLMAKDLYKVKDNIITLAISRGDSYNTGPSVALNRFMNIDEITWDYDESSDNYILSSSSYFSLNTIGFSFKVGSDLKTALDIIGTPIGGEITQITQEEYENIFNS